MINLKLKLGEEVRRIGKAPESFEAVKKKAIELFNISNPSFRYKDTDNDMITVMTQEEYEDSLSAHKTPFKLEVIETEMLFLKRSSVLSASMNAEEPIFKYGESYEESMIYPQESDPNIPDHLSTLIQTDEIVLADQSTSGPELKDQCVEASLTAEVGTACETQFNSLQELIKTLKRHFNTHARDKKFYLGVKCFKCHHDIYDVVYKCDQCSWLFMCEDCESNDTHSHPLIKSRNKVMHSPSKTAPPTLKACISPSALRQTEKIELKQSASMFNFETTDKGDKSGRSDLSLKLDSLKNMGFDNKHQCMDALVINGYNLEQCIDYLLKNSESDKS